MIPPPYGESIMHLILCMEKKKIFFNRKEIDFNIDCTV